MGTLAGQFAKASALKPDAKEEVLAFSTFPQEQWHQNRPICRSTADDHTWLPARQYDGSAAHAISDHALVKPGLVRSHTAHIWNFLAPAPGGPQIDENVKPLVN